VGVNKIEALKLRAAIEFGSDYTYTIRRGGLGLTLYVDAETRENAKKARASIPVNWEGLYVIILYRTDRDEDDILYDPALK